MHQSMQVEKEFEREDDLESLRTSFTNVSVKDSGELHESQKTPRPERRVGRAREIRQKFNSNSIDDIGTLFQYSSFNSNKNRFRKNK